MKTLGASLELVEPGRVHIAVPFSPDLTQQHGFLHAGTIAAVADSACGYAALSLMPADAGVLSIEFKVNMLAPAKGDAIVAPDGKVLAGPVFDREEIVSAEIDLQRVREESMTLDVTGHYSRPDCFEFRPIHHPRPVA